VDQTYSILIGQAVERIYLMVKSFNKDNLKAQTRAIRKKVYLGEILILSI